MEIKVRLNDENLAHGMIAMRIASTFAKDYPDRIGFSHGVVYTTNCGCLETHRLAFYTYRTPKGTIVVREC